VSIDGSALPNRKALSVRKHRGDYALRFGTWKSQAPPLDSLNPDQAGRRIACASSAGSMIPAYLSEDSIEMMASPRTPHPRHRSQCLRSRIGVRGKAKATGRS
jgi:hypothetical protein